MAVDDIIAVQHVIADRIGVRPHMHAVAGEGEENEAQHDSISQPNPNENQ